MADPAGIPPFKEVRQALDALGFKPSRRLGQNFLLDPTLHEVIAGAAELSPQDRVLEIGSGPGFLTYSLRASGAKVLAVEVDARLVEVATSVLGPGDGVVFLNQDVLAGKNELNPLVVERARQHGGERGLKVVANLPYSVSGPVLALLALSDLPIRKMVCLVQKELAHRLLARPGEKEWGALGFAVGLRFETTYLRTVPPQVFRPKPKVDSGLVSLTPLDKPYVESGEPARSLTAATRDLFTQKRKTLGAALRSLGWAGWEEGVERAGLDGARRVWTLDWAEMVRLFQALKG